MAKLGAPISANSQRIIETSLTIPPWKTLGPSEFPRSARANACSGHAVVPLKLKLILC
jgi:hypothetical protein